VRFRSRIESWFGFGLLAVFALLFLLTALGFTQAQQPAPPSITSQPAQNPPPPNPPPAPPAFVVVLDPAHGGTDNGARGASGLVEKNLTLELARATQAELQRQGINVISSRDGDENPSFDDRATLANTPRLAIFITFHVSSTGAPGTARAYFERFATPDVAATSASQTGHGMIAWTEAQRPYVGASQRLADLIQSGLAQNLRGSPDKSSSFAIRDLRSVAAPAVAVELSSVSSLDQAGVERMSGPIAICVARAIAQFRPGYERQLP
jgi:N-acetylmuramoyl-L-alanine amidase